MGTDVTYDGRATVVGSADWIGTFADGSMTGKVALIRRGACYLESFSSPPEPRGARTLYRSHTFVWSGGTQADRRADNSEATTR
jgi:hypothetical protein